MNRRTCSSSTSDEIGKGGRYCRPRFRHHSQPIKIDRTAMETAPIDPSAIGKIGFFFAGFSILFATNFKKTKSVLP